MKATPPSRKALLAAFERRTLLVPLCLLALDTALFAAGFLIALLARPVPVKFLGSALVSGAIVRLFLIGHDACHGSYFASKRLNAIVGRLTFLPSLTAFSLWDVGHNVAHHGFNNLKGRDQVWAPFSKAEFDSLPPHRRWLERVYRSGYGCGVYYLLELWWKKLYFASRREIGSTRLRYQLDSLLVTAGAALWLAVTVVVAVRTGQSIPLLVAAGVVLPFLIWNGIMGFVVFVHHTHPSIPWFSKRHEWQRCRAYLTATAQVRLPFRVDRLMHGIMEHNAHHVNPRISMFQLPGAQQVLREHHAAEVAAYQLDWAAYRDCVRRCKLYDFANHRWLDFSGAETSRTLPAASAG